MPDIKEFLSLKPDDLAQRQRDALAQFAADRLREIARLIENGEYQEARKYLEGSPAGDEMGMDNSFICFDDAIAPHCDVGDVLDCLEGYDRTIAAAQKKGKK